MIFKKLILITYYFVKNLIKHGYYPKNSTFDLIYSQYSKISKVCFIKHYIFKKI